MKYTKYPTLVKYKALEYNKFGKIKIKVRFENCNLKKLP